MLTLIIIMGEFDQSLNFNDFVIKEKIGSGAFSEVFKV